MDDQAYWLFSVPPEDGSLERTWQRLQKATATDRDLSVNHRLNLPALKVGTMDQLMSLSDDLGKADAAIEATSKKIARELLELLQTRPGDEGDQASSVSAEVLTRASLEVNGLQVETYLTKFQWDEAKYPTKQPLREIVDNLLMQIANIDKENKIKYQEYATLKQQLSVIERNANGNLMVREISDLVKKEDFVESENLTTLLIVVPEYMQKDWVGCYESLTKFVVPRSSRVLFQDGEYVLNSVVCFRRIAEDFKIAAREKRFNPRDFTYNETTMKETKENKVVLEADLKRTWAALVRWCQANFGEAFSAWIHMKAVRLFVESVLRYGLPAEFLYVLAKPQKKQAKKLHSELMSLYSHLSGRGADKSERIDAEDPRSLAEAYFPYVFQLVSLLVQ